MHFSPFAPSLWVAVHVRPYFPLPLETHFRDTLGFFKRSGKTQLSEAFHPHLSESRLRPGPGRGVSAGSAGEEVAVLWCLFCAGSSGLCIFFGFCGCFPAGLSGRVRPRAPGTFFFFFFLIFFFFFIIVFFVCLFFLDVRGMERATTWGGGGPG